MDYKESYERMKTPKIPALVPEIFKFEKCVKYSNETTNDVIYSTQKKHSIYKWSSYISTEIYSVQTHRIKIVSL